MPGSFPRPRRRGRQRARLTAVRFAPATRASTASTSGPVMRVSHPRKSTARSVGSAASTASHQRRLTRPQRSSARRDSTLRWPAFARSFQCKLCILRGEKVIYHETVHTAHPEIDVINESVWFEFSDVPFGSLDDRIDVGFDFDVDVAEMVKRTGELESKRASLPPALWLALFHEPASARIARCRFGDFL